ncbi:hypothetical protein E4U79_07595 [Escherichia coli O157:H7]|nr:hypothetical protein C9E72_07965 [Escherichia coli]QCL41557.1 hypothetical protein C9E68_07970 [Escherichia coli]QJZ43060.1 hypothetical protein E4U79_07595 [Escherichia coli O157:H7]
MTDFGGKTSIFSHPVYLFLREFSLQDFRGGSGLQSFATGAIGGAASGAMIGSAVPVIGTGIGALAGGVIGGLGSLF